MTPTAIGRTSDTEASTSGTPTSDAPTSDAPTSDTPISDESSSSETSDDDGTSTTDVDELPPPTGEQRAFQYGGTSNEAVMTLAFVGDHHVAFAGTSESELDFGAGPIAPDEHGNLLLAVVDVRDGAPVIARRYAAVVDFVVSVVGTADGGFLITGMFSEEGTLGAFTLEGDGPMNAFVAKLDAAGEPQWVHTRGEVGEITGAAAVAEDAEGSVLALSSADAGPITLTKLDGDGQVVFEVANGSLDAPEGWFSAVRSAVVDHNGDVLAMGKTIETFAWSDTVPDSGFSGIVALKLSGADGSPIWGAEVQSGDFWRISPASIVVDSAGDAYVSGHTESGFQITRLAGTDGTNVWTGGPLAVESSGEYLVIGRDDSMYVLLNLAADATVAGTDLDAGAWLAAVDRQHGNLADPIAIPHLGNAISGSQNGFFGQGAMARGPTGTIAIESSFYDTVTTADGEHTSAGAGDVLLVAIDPA